MAIKKNQASQLAIENQNFLPWLHALTIIGHSENIVIPPEHLEVIAYLFLDDATAAQAMREYKKFLKRWKAIQTEWES